MSSTRGRRACCRQEHCSCKPCLLRLVVVPDLKFTQQCLSPTETSQLTYLLPRHEETLHALNTHVWHHADHQSQGCKSCSVIVSFSRELLIQFCPVPELPPTYQLLAMVRDGVSGPWIICWGSVQSFQTKTSALCGDIGCTLISLSCQNGIRVVMAIIVHCVPLAHVKERAHRTSLGYHNSYIHLSCSCVYDVASCISL